MSPHKSGARTPERQGSRRAATYAALDLGTNNCRLLIAEAGTASKPHDHPPLKVVDSFSRIVRLGEGVSQTGKLSDDAMTRTLAALTVCARKLQRYPEAHIRLVATEACRRAGNGEEFLRRAKQETGLDLEIIDGEEEARLAFLGCASLLAESAERALVFDIGGGSTEFMWTQVAEGKSGRKRHISDWLSVNVGVMNLADRFGGQAFADVVFEDMVKHFSARLEAFDAKNRISETMQDGGVQMLSTSGTITTLAAIHLDLPRYDRTRIDGITLSTDDLRATIRRLLAMRPSERFHHPCIGPDRADYILSGSAIFEAVNRLWPAENITIADRGVREGIIISLMSEE